jgi:hypothetical protein
MTQADCVFSTPPLNSSSIQKANPAPDARADSADSFSGLPAIAQPASRNHASDSPKPLDGLSRRKALASLAMLPAITLPGAACIGADAELNTLSKKFERLVDDYYAAHKVWSPALAAAHLECEDCVANDTGFEEACERNGVDQACERLDAVEVALSPVANAILALPVTSIEGLRAVTLVAFQELAPSAGDREYQFDNPPTFQRLFMAVAQLCGLVEKVTATGYVLPWPAVDSDYDGEEA